MFKNLTILSLALLALGPFSLISLQGNSIETAQDYYSQRNPTTKGLEYTKKALKVYTDLISRGQSEKIDLAAYHNAASECLYYIGTNTADHDSKLDLYKKGLKHAKIASKLISTAVGKPVNQEQVTKTTLAISYYWIGAQTGRIMEAKQSPDGLNYLFKVDKAGIKLDRTVYDYGHYRTLGKIYHKLPFPMGSNRKAMAFLKKSHDSTIRQGTNISCNGSNVLFYAEILIAKDKEDQAKEILEEFIVQDPETFNTERIPETKVEQSSARKLLNSLD